MVLQKFVCLAVLNNSQLSGKCSDFLHYSRAEKTNKATTVLHQAGHREESFLGQAAESEEVLAQSRPYKVNDLLHPLHYDFC